MGFHDPFSPRNLVGRGVVHGGMVVIGCLSLFLLPLIGLVVGGYFGGLTVGLWVAAGGFLLALAACCLSFFALMKARPSR